MPRRDPQTGQFVAGDDWDDIEVASFRANTGVQAADLNGGVGFTGEQVSTYEGLELLDYDELVDRNEELVLLEAEHHMTVWQNSTATEDGVTQADVEISASPSGTMTGGIFNNSFDDTVTVGGSETTDTIDLIGRTMVATAHSPFSDTTNGMGGGGSEGTDTVRIEHPPAEMARFHPRDELFLNGSFTTWNIADAGIHVEVTGQHVYGVLSD